MESLDSKANKYPYIVSKENTTLTNEEGIVKALEALHVGKNHA